MKFSTIAAASLLAVALSAGTIALSFASSDSSDREPTLTSTPAGTSTASRADSELLAELEALRGTQSASEIAALMASATEANRVEVLVGENGEYLSAIASEPTAASIFRLTP